MLIEYSRLKRLHKASSVFPPDVKPQFSHTLSYSRLNVSLSTNGHVLVIRGHTESLSEIQVSGGREVS